MAFGPTAGLPRGCEEHEHTRPGDGGKSHQGRSLSMVLEGWPKIGTLLFHKELNWKLWSFVSRYYLEATTPLSLLLNCLHWAGWARCMMSESVLVLVLCGNKYFMSLTHWRHYIHPDYNKNWPQTSPELTDFLYESTLKTLIEWLHEKDGTIGLITWP